MQARKLRPIRREISWVRPPTLPLTLSRSPRVLVARGSIAYSQVTQPRPEPLRQRGTPSVTLAVHSTRVSPYSTRTDPSGWRLQFRVIVIGRSWSGVRPSGRGMPPSLSAGAVPATHGTRAGCRRRRGPLPIMVGRPAEGASVGMIMQYVRIRADELATLRRLLVEDPNGAFDYVDALADGGEEDVPAQESRALDTDRAWAAIDYLL